MPRHRERDARVADLGGIDRDVLAESSLVPFLFLDARREYAPPVPITILVLAQVYHRVLRHEVAEQDSAIEQIARVVRNFDGSRRKEDGVFVIAYLERVDCHAGEEAATQVADVHLPLHFPFEHRHHHLAHAVLAEARMRDADDAEDEYQSEPHQD